MVFVKVRGIRAWEEADAAPASGAAALGFPVGPTHRAEDGIDAETARAIVRRLPAPAESVLVTHLLDPERVAALVASIGARTAQVHGEMALPGLCGASARWPPARGCSRRCMSRARTRLAMPSPTPR